MKARIRLVAALLPGLALFSAPDEARSPELSSAQLAAQSSSRTDDARCAICHPGATKGLRQSVHQGLLIAPETKANSCSACHGDLSNHADAARRPEDTQIVPAAVDQATCTSCHKGKGFATRLAAHPWHRPQDLQDLAAVGKKPADWPEIEKTGLANFDWQGLVQIGYRFVSTQGSYDRYQTDIDLEPGMRLQNFELEGKGEARYLDSLRAEAQDLGDPYSRYSAELRKTDLYRGRAGYRRSIYAYRASGDYHRVDKKSKSADFDLSFDVNPDVQVFGSYSNQRENGYWLTNRIGNQNLTPLSTISGVQSPRDLRGDDFELGISGSFEDIAYTLAAQYRDESSVESWGYSRPAIANNAFTESENFVSASDLEGPGARFSLARAFGKADLDLSGRFMDLDRRIDANGTGSGYDVSDFTSSTVSRSRGSAQTFVLEGSLSWELDDAAVLITDLRWRDHRERMRIDQTDTSVYPNLSSTTTVTTGRDQFTSQRVFDGSVELEFEPFEAVILSAGYGFAHEELEVPDLESGDNDFRRGTAHNHGILAGIDYRPTEHWALIGRFSDFGQTGLQLHDLTMRDARTLDGRLRYTRDALRTEIFARNRHSENEVSFYRFDSTTYGITSTWTEPDRVSLFGSYSYTETDSRTLTNFYFDPDPNPHATVVGFTGDTHSLIAGFDFQVSKRVNWRGDFSWSKTHGDFDLSVLDYRTDLSFRVTQGGAAGIEYRQIDYREQLGTDDYRTDLIMIYWRQPF